MNLTIQEIFNIILNLTLLDIFNFVVGSAIQLTMIFLIGGGIVFLLFRIFGWWDKIENNPKSSILWGCFPIIVVFMILFAFYFLAM